VKEPLVEQVFSREAVREVDRQSIETYGIPGIILMENAARELAVHSMRMLGRPLLGSMLILCGGGNNAGDGFAAARHLHNQGVECTLFLLRPAESYRGDAATNLKICRAMRLTIVEAPEEPVEVLASLGEFALILDGLLGTGLDREVGAPFDAVIEYVNKQNTPVLSIDIPSGLDCDSGQPRGVAIKADATVTFVGVKKGFRAPGAEHYTGRVIVADIGAPCELVESLGELP
jgi:NAD(P)H-hydrate epimerase